MAASVGDKFTDTYNAANPNVARVTVARTSGATSLTCDNLAGWPTNTKVHFSTYQINTSNAVVAGTQIDWYGIVSGNTIGSLTRITGATDAGNSIGDVVEMNPTASWAHDLYSGLAVEHNNDGTHGAVTATSVTTSGAVLTTPKVITAINDTNGNELFKVTATASAVNEITVANAATGNAPQLSATGGDTNIDLKLAPKGSGNVTGVVENMKNPYKFSVYRSAALTTAGSAWTEVPFDTKNFDTGTNIDVSTNKGRFTAPISGFYFFSAAVSLASGTGAFAVVSLYLNGAVTNGLVGAQIYSSVAGTTLVPTISGFMQLTAGDYVEVYVNQNAANPATVNSGKFNTWFQGFLVSRA